MELPAVVPFERVANDPLAILIMLIPLSPTKPAKGSPARVMARAATTPPTEWESHEHWLCQADSEFAPPFVWPVQLNTSFPWPLKLP